MRQRAEDQCGAAQEPGLTCNRDEGEGEEEKQRDGRQSRNSRGGGDLSVSGAHGKLSPLPLAARLVHRIRSLKGESHIPLKRHGQEPSLSALPLRALLPASRPSVGGAHGRVLNPSTGAGRGWDFAEPSWAGLCVAGV